MLAGKLHGQGTRTLSRRKPDDSCHTNKGVLRVYPKQFGTLQQLQRWTLHGRPTSVASGGTPQQPPHSQAALGAGRTLQRCRTLFQPPTPALLHAAGLWPALPAWQPRLQTAAGCAPAQRSGRLQTPAARLRTAFLQVPRRPIRMVRGKWWLPALTALLQPALLQGPQWSAAVTFL